MYKRKNVFKKSLISLFAICAIAFFMFGFSAGKVKDNNRFTLASADVVENVDYSEWLLYDPRMFDGDSDENTFNYLPSVKNQGQLGLCWAYAIAGSIEIDLYKNFDVEVDIAEKYLAYFAKNGYDGNSENGTYGDGFKSVSGVSVDYNAIYNGGGSFEYTLATLIAGWGLYEQDYIDNTNSLYTYLQNPASVEWENYRFGDVASVVGAVNYNGNESIAIIKDKIVENGSVITSVQMEDLGSELYNSNTYAYYASSSNFTATDHMVEIVGWDDNFSVTNFATAPSGNGAWLVRNSWGTGWGDSGYVWVSYYDTGILNTGYNVIEIEGYNSNQCLYQYECGTDWTAHMSSTAITYASIYKNNTQYEQEINAIGLQIWTGEDGNSTQECEIKIYRNSQSMTRPTDGVLIQTLSKTFYNSGYYKINLTSAIKLESGVSFSVVVTNDSSVKGYACFEGEGSEGYGIYRNSSSGQSFLKTGSVWKDTSNEISGFYYNNAGIKVYAVRTECIEHSYDSGVHTASTCKSYAKTVYSCTVCGNIKEVVDSAGGYAEHDYKVIGHTDGDCCKYGFTSYECDICGDIKTENDTSYGEHNYISNFHIDGTCETKGYTVAQYCTICKEEKGLKTLDANYGAHKYKDKVTVEGDCKHYTRTLEECEVCGDTNTIEKTELGYGRHQFTEVLENGEVKVVRCSVDGCNENFYIKTENNASVIDVTESEKIAFCLSEISNVSDTLNIKLKNGNIAITLSKKGLTKADYFVVELKECSAEDVSRTYSVDNAYSSSLFYIINVTANGVLLNGLEIEIYCDVIGMDSIQFYNPAGTDQTKFTNGTVTQNGVKGNLNSGIYSFKLWTKESDSDFTFEFKWEYLIVVAVIIAIIVVGELSAKGRRKQEDSE